MLNWKKHNIREEFYFKKSYMEHRLQKDVMEDGSGNHRIRDLTCLDQKNHI